MEAGPYRGVLSVRVRARQAAGSAEAIDRRFTHERWCCSTNTRTSFDPLRAALGGPHVQATGFAGGI
jgi:hypothetical protein